jgi:hypothetical protein
MSGKVLNIKVYNPLKLRSGLSGKHHAICHYSYNFSITAKQKKNDSAEINSFNLSIFCGESFICGE